jgi:hypothetical protein
VCSSWVLGNFARCAEQLFVCVCTPVCATPCVNCVHLCDKRVIDGVRRGRVCALGGGWGKWFYSL